MSEKLELEQLPTGAGEPAHAPTAVGDLRRLSAVPVDLSVEIGRARMSVGETLELREGSVVTLDRMAGEPVDLLVNGRPIARGEVVVIDEQFGLRLTQVLAAPGGADTGAPSDAEHSPAAAPSEPLRAAAREPPPAAQTLKRNRHRPTIRLRARAHRCLWPARKQEEQGHDVRAGQQPTARRLHPGC
jgi:flagellar motor switch protein FliN/FliY